MMEDVEDGGGNAAYEDGEIQEGYYQQSGHQPRSQSQSFMAPRFAALAAQQEQADSMGPTGRPQLAPGFMFGARRRGVSGPMAPPINEDDLNFQFPQQQQQPQQNFGPDSSHNDQAHRKSESAEIGGIMAEQVRIFELFFEQHRDTDMSSLLATDCTAESDRGTTAATAGSLSTTACFESGSVFPDSGTRS